MAIGNLSAGIMQILPRMADSAFDVPLICLLPDPNGVVDSIIGTFCTPELADSGLFTVVQDQIYANMCAYSGVPLDGNSKKPLVKANDADLPPDQLVETYLGGTPVHELLLTPAPFELPSEQRFAGHWIVAPPGRGKTTLLHRMVLDDIQTDAAIVLMDSKGDLIEPIKTLLPSKTGCFSSSPTPIPPSP